MGNEGNQRTTCGHETVLDFTIVFSSNISNSRGGTQKLWAFRGLRIDTENVDGISIGIRS